MIQEALQGAMEDFTARLHSAQQEAKALINDPSETTAPIVSVPKHLPEIRRKLKVRQKFR